MPLQGKKLPQAATYVIIQNQKGQTRLIKVASLQLRRSSRSIESDPFGSFGFENLETLVSILGETGKQCACEKDFRASQRNAASHAEAARDKESDPN